MDSGGCWVSHNLHSRLFHLVIYGYIFLGAAEEFVPNKLHDHLGRDAAVRELGDKPRRPLWLDAPLMPALRYSSPNSWQSAFHCLGTPLGNSR